MTRPPAEPLDPAFVRDVVQRALAEDLGRGDVTTAATVEENLRAHGAIVVKADCVLAGLDVAAEVFRQLNPGVAFAALRRDGDRCGRGEVVATVTGPARALLTAERTALNFLQRLSGIATLTRRFVEAAGGHLTVLDTRKTTPTLRALEKYAVRAGGGINHRFRLDEALLVKDNHVRLAGGVAEAVRRARTAAPNLPLEVEAQSLDQVNEALTAGVDTVLVDNLSIEDVREAVRRARGRARVEVSGGVTLDCMPELAATGADWVSVGALTHSASAADLSLELEPMTA